MIWFVIAGIVLLYGVWRFAPLTRDLYVSEETRIYYATGRHARPCAFVDWSSVEHLSAWSNEGETENDIVLDSER